MGLNEDASDVADEMEMHAAELGIGVHRLGEGSRVLDCGVHAEGGLEAGRLFASVCLGGSGNLAIADEKYGRHILPTIKVEVENPALPCLGSQKAGWKIKVGDFFAMGSGPARLLKDPAGEYSEESGVAVLALECSALPGSDVAAYIAEKCRVKAENLTLLAARTASIVGSTQVSARMLETALYKMEHLGMDADVVKGFGAAPIAPVTGGDKRMMGVSNDMIIYGSEVQLNIRGDLDVEPIPSSSSKDYGTPFMEAFKKAGYDFYKIDQGIFAPAKVTVKNIYTGETREAGGVNVGILMRSLQNG